MAAAGHTAVPVALASALASTLLLASCASTPGSGSDSRRAIGTTTVPTHVTTPSGRIADLAAASAMWAAAGVRDYDLTVRRGCHCPTVGLVRVSVRSGAVVTTTVDPNPGQPERTPLSASAWPTSVEALFDEIVARQADSASVMVRYDQTNGVPLQINVDRIAEALDDEVSFRVTFEPR